MMRVTAVIQPSNGSYLLMKLLMGSAAANTCGVPN